MSEPTTTSTDDALDPDDLAALPNWDGECLVCGCGPTVGDTDLCGPCCFGTADAVGGNW